MQAKKQSLAKAYQKVLWLLPPAALLIWQAGLVWMAAVQLFMGMLVALAALPLMRRLEKKLKPGLAASLAMTSLTLILLGSLLMLAPTLIAQGKQIIGALPEVYARGSQWVQTTQEWLAKNGMEIDENMKQNLLGRGEKLLSGAAGAAGGWLKGAAQSLGKWMLAPLFAYYFLRDRQKIGEWLLSLVPVGQRKLTVKMLKEMKRETAGYLRGQLMISAVVGLLTALGLLLCGVPAWLLLGTVMGVLELIPYAGPFLGGVLVFLFSWQRGLARLLWAMGVVLLVQQLEGGMLSPQLMSGATRLHPVAVLLCVMLGGAAGGIGGVLLAVPLLLCLRAALRIVCLERSIPTEKMPDPGAE